jgi:hypothetical protein
MEKTSPAIKSIVKQVFPSYRGRKITVTYNPPPKVLDSYWDGGSKDFWAFYDLASGQVLNITSNHPFYEPSKPRDLEYLPENVLLLNNVCFCGKWIGVRVYINPNNNILI